MHDGASRSALIFVDLPDIITLYRMRMQGYCDVYKWTILKRTSPEVECLHPTSSRREMCTSSVSNVIYHKFSHGAAFYTLNGKNVNVMLEFMINHVANVKVFNFRALMTSHVNMCVCRRPLQNNP